MTVLNAQLIQIIDASESRFIFAKHSLQVRLYVLSGTYVPYLVETTSRIKKEIDIDIEKQNENYTMIRSDQIRCNR